MHSKTTHIPAPTKQLLKPHNTQSKQNKETTCTYKAKPLCIPVPKDKKCIKDSHLNTPKKLHTSNNPTNAKQPNYYETVNLTNTKVNSSHYTLQQTRK